MRTLQLFTGILTGLMLLSPTVHSQYYNVQPCVDEVLQRVEREHRIFRSVLFGHRSAERASVGTVDYSADGIAWYKIAEDTWETEQPEKGGGPQIPNEQMNDISETRAAFGVAERKGIFETKRMTTSELLPYIGSSLRAFQCRLATVCETLDLSKTQQGDQPVSLKVAPPSCVQSELPSIPACHVNARGTIPDDVILFHSCSDAMEQMLTQEAALLTAVVQYDAAYRSLLHIAGSMDIFLQEFTFPFHTTLESVADVVQAFSRLPCFLASCDASAPLP